MKIFFAIILFSFSFLSCKKENSQLSNGTYTGIFKVIYPSGTYSGPVSISLNDSIYHCSRNSNRIPAGGSGSFSNINSKLTFKDINIWTADFDWNLVLEGEYDFSFDGISLKLWATKNNVGYYEYSLKKEY